MLLAVARRLEAETHIVVRGHCAAVADVVIKISLQTLYQNVAQSSFCRILSAQSSICARGFTAGRAADPSLATFA